MRGCSRSARAPRATMMKRDAWLTLLPPVLIALALRIFIAVQSVFRLDGSQSGILLQEDAIGLAVLVGLPALLVFGAVRLWMTRDIRLQLGILVLSAATAAAILTMS